jgi:hypothetical protein
LLGLSHIVLTLRLTVKILPMVRIRLHPGGREPNASNTGLRIHRIFAYLHLDPHFPILCDFAEAVNRFLRLVGGA